MNGHLNDFDCFTARQAVLLAGKVCAACWFQRFEQGIELS